MKDTVDPDLAIALRRRIQAQALCHRAGASVPGTVVMRFRKAGTWDGDIALDVDPALRAVLTGRSGPDHVPLPPGPMVAVLDGDVRQVHDVCEYLVYDDPEIRLAAFRHFASAAEHVPCWVSPYVFGLLECHADAIGSDEESTWIDAGLVLRDAIELDFRVNCAGVRQARVLSFDEVFQQFMNRVVWPKAECFQHDRPPVWDPSSESCEILRHIDDWSTLDNLSSALNAYLDYCGFLPLAGELSAGAVVEKWAAHHSEADVWSLLWEWVESCPSALAEYHAAHAFLEHPRWIRVSEWSTLESRIRDVIRGPASDASSDGDPRWRLRSDLQQHFQFHLEATAPGLEGGVLGASAAWMAEIVSQLLGGEFADAEQRYQFVETRILPLSTRRWASARSRVAPRPLRIEAVTAPFVWSDALLATAVRAFALVPCEVRSTEYRQFLIEQMTSAICNGSLRVVDRNSPYAFDQVVSASDVELREEENGEEYKLAAIQVIAVRGLVEGDEAGGLLSDLREHSNHLRQFVCNSLRTWRIARDTADKLLPDLLNDSEWRLVMFQESSIETLESLSFFLSEWALQQDDEWLLRVAHIFALECERATSEDRRVLLLTATTVLALAADVASPVVRLLAGTHRVALSPMVDAWRQTARQLAVGAEPWLASRIRGFLGTIDAAL